MAKEKRSTTSLTINCPQWLYDYIVKRADVIEYSLSKYGLCILEKWFAEDAPSINKLEERLAEIREEEAKLKKADEEAEKLQGVT